MRSDSKLVKDGATGSGVTAPLQAAIGSTCLRLAKAPSPGTRRAKGYGEERLLRWE